MSQKIVVVGNGVVALQIALSILDEDPSCRVELIGPSTRTGSATIAAAAMFASFAEVDPDTLTNQFERTRFDFNRESNSLWPALVQRLRSVQPDLSYGFGTYVINNATTSDIEDLSFNSILKALQDFECEHELVNPMDIPMYRPSPRERALRAVLINGEGWIDPVQLLTALNILLHSTKRFSYVDSMAIRIDVTKNQITGIECDNGSKIVGDSYVIANGASFTKLMINSSMKEHFQEIFYGVGATIVLKTNQYTLTNCIRTPNRGLACGLYSAPRDSQSTVIGASNFVTDNPESYIRLASLDSLVGGAGRQISQDFYKSQLLQINVGWRPISEDTLPLIGKAHLVNLFIATGTRRDGLHCSPAIGNSIAKLVLNNDSSGLPEIFSPNRLPHKVWNREETVRRYVDQKINAHLQHGLIPSMDAFGTEYSAHIQQDIENTLDNYLPSGEGLPLELIGLKKFRWSKEY